MTAPAFALETVGKEYPHGWFGRRRLTALEGVSVRADPGEVIALVGPNRAGKTTLVKVLLSLCAPSAGRGTRLGRPLTDRSTLARVGYVHEAPAFPRYLSAVEVLHYCGALARLPEPDVRRRAADLLERVGLADRAREPIARFSKGMVQRLALAQALLNDPDLLVLDEPAEGLDLFGRQLLHAAVREGRARQRTTLLVSHQLSEVEELCDRAVVLARGRVVHDAPIDRLTRDATTGVSRPLGAALLPYYQMAATS